MSRLFDGKTVVLTGSAGGIGAAVADRFASEGARLVLSDVNADSLMVQESRLRALGADVIAVPGDISRPSAADSLLREADRAFGGVHVLVNNAGIEYRADVAAHSTQDWENVLSVNLTAPFRLVRAALATLTETAGAVVNVSSVAMFGFSKQVAYDASKGGLATLTRSLAVELGGRGIRVNALCPGLIDTVMLDKSGLREIANRQGAALPVRRIGRTDEVAAAVAWLASDESSYVTGQCLFVDGGWFRQ